MTGSDAIRKALDYGFSLGHGIEALRASKDLTAEQKLQMLRYAEKRIGMAVAELEAEEGEPESSGKKAEAMGEPSGDGWKTVCEMEIPVTGPMASGIIETILRGEATAETFRKLMGGR